MKANHGADHFKCIEEQAKYFDYNGVLETGYLCIAAGLKHLPDGKFSLIRVMPEIQSTTEWSMYFYVTYSLPTCTKVILMLYI